MSADNASATPVVRIDQEPTAGDLNEDSVHSAQPTLAIDAIGLKIDDEEASSTAYEISAPASNASDWTKWHTSKKRMEKSKVLDLTIFKSKYVRDFYRRQNDTIQAFENLRHARQKRAVELGQAVEGSQASPRAEDLQSVDQDSKPAVKFAINISFTANVALFIIKIIAAISSGSIAVVASVIDSALDLLSGSIIYLAARAAARKDAHKYPIGKTRLEPVSVVIFAAVMSVAAAQLFIESIRTLASGLNGHPPDLRVDATTYGILGTVIAVKAILLFICWGLRNESSSVEALADDHRNDVLSNAVTIVAVAIASALPKATHPLAWLVDPITAMIVAILIVINWVGTGKEIVDQLTGRVASTDILGQLTYIALSHCHRDDSTGALHAVKAVDTVRAYHVGSKIVAEVDIVLPEDMPLRQAHDIGESLVHELECHPLVERAHVHLDWESDHKAEDEHQYPHSPA